MTNQVSIYDMTVDQLRVEASRLHAAADAATAQRITVEGIDPVMAWRYRTESAMLRAQAQHLAALAIDRADPVRVGLGDLAMTREVSGMTDPDSPDYDVAEQDAERDDDVVIWVIVNDYGRGIIVAGPFGTAGEAHAWNSTDDRFVVCAMTRRQYRYGSWPWADEADDSDKELTDRVAGIIIFDAIGRPACDALGTPRWTQALRTATDVIAAVREASAVRH